MFERTYEKMKTTLFDIKFNYWYKIWFCCSSSIKKNRWHISWSKEDLACSQSL